MLGIEDTFLRFEKSGKELHFLFWCQLGYSGEGFEIFIDAVGERAVLDFLGTTLVCEWVEDAEAELFFKVGIVFLQFLNRVCKATRGPRTFFAINKMVAPGLFALLGG
jgi:hypothetical protein